MPLPVFTNIPTSDLDVNSPLKEHVLRELRDNQHYARRYYTSWFFANVTQPNASYQGIAYFRPWIPDPGDYTGIVRQLEVRIIADYSTAQPAFLRLRDEASLVEGPEVQVTTHDLANPKTLILPIDSSWINTQRLVYVRAKAAAGGSVNIYSDFLLGNILVIY